MNSGYGAVRFCASKLPRDERLISLKSFQGGDKQKTQSCRVSSAFTNIALKDILNKTNKIDCFIDWISLTLQRFIIVGDSGISVVHQKRHSTARLDIPNLTFTNL